MSTQIQKLSELNRAILLHGILGNALWMYLYIKFIWFSDIIENAAVNYYVREEADEFLLIYYINDNAIFAYLIPTTFLLWRLSKNEKYHLLCDAVRAIIILVWVFLILLQPMLLFSYMFGPRSW